MRRGTTEVPPVHLGVVLCQRVLSPAQPQPLPDLGLFPLNRHLVTHINWPGGSLLKPAVILRAISFRTLNERCQSYRDREW